ncbi:MAG TPA: hypothetical protein VJT82_05635, partial [Pyrinomonadaceae bacterium]|nr:hypothetical protein [Pyrinomonadaceae bacterium]
MKISNTHLPNMRRAVVTLAGLLAFVCAALTPAFAQTSGGTIISNKASASYTDGSNTYNTDSNTVTVQVANVSGLRILPDDQVNSAAVPGDTNVNFLFTVTNTGNFADQ